MVRKDAWNDLDFLEFIKFRFMAQDVMYPGEGSMSTWEKGEIHCFGGEMSYRYHLGLTGPLYHLKFVLPC